MENFFDTIGRAFAKARAFSPSDLAAVWERASSISLAATAAELTTELLLAYSLTLSMAVFCVYVGARESCDLSGRARAAGRQTETISSRDAGMFPLVGSAMLFGMYLAFKFVAKSLVNLLVSLYFSAFAVGAVTWTLGPVLDSRFFVGRRPYRIFWTPLWAKTSADNWEFNMTRGDVCAAVVGVVVGVAYFATKHWALNNIVGMCFAVQAIVLINIGTYPRAALLLIGLFFYDIFWVFGTDVMVDVARNFDGPIKLLSPKNWPARNLQFSMLGLGDIVLPGLLVALLARFDRDRRPARRDTASVSFVYFHATLVAYVAGLVFTLFIMHALKAAQPALLYLVPCVLIAPLAVAVTRGELGALFSYEDVDTTAETGTRKSK